MQSSSDQGVPGAGAAGLGPIKLQSTLGQGFAAEIDVLGLQPSPGHHQGRDAFVGTTSGDKVVQAELDSARGTGGEHLVDVRQAEDGLPCLARVQGRVDRPVEGPRPGAVLDAPDDIVLDLLVARRRFHALL